jgi:hypothetical protein
MGIAHTNAIGRPGMAACCRVAIGRASAGPWLTDAMVKYFAGGWTVQELAAIEQELDRQGVQYTIDGDDLLLHDDHEERRVDMIVESITET